MLARRMTTLCSFAARTANFAEGACSALSTRLALRTDDALRPLDRIEAYEAAANGVSHALRYFISSLLRTRTRGYVHCPCAEFDKLFVVVPDGTDDRLIDGESLRACATTCRIYHNADFNTPSGTHLSVSLTVCF